MNKTRGRPRGGSDARERILAAARQRFIDDGYAAASVRAIARDAGVDHALVNYYFGSKDQLFGEIAHLVLTPGRVTREVFDSPNREDLPHRILVAFTGAWEDPVTGPPLIAMVRDALADDAAQAVLRGYVEGQLVTGLAERLGGPSATQRAGAVAAVLWGLVIGRYVFALGPVATMSRREVIVYLRPAVAGALAGPPPVAQRGRGSRPPQSARWTALD